MNVAIEFRDVCKAFKRADYYAVCHIDCKIYNGELITILGSSGCGKTTLLKMINRIYEPDRGVIELFGRNISKTDPVRLRRRVGYVIQQIGLFPHMTIAQNIGVVPKLLRWPKDKTNQRIAELLEVVGLDSGEYQKRYPSQLSGGQQQRVGLARALCVDPDVMLLDEPFGALDAITRSRLQDELLRIHAASKKTFLFVTHDINEAFKLGNRVLIMDQGRIMQFDTPEEIISNPANDFVRSLIDSFREQEQFWKEFG